MKIALWVLNIVVDDANHRLVVFDILNKLEQT